MRVKIRITQVECSIEPDGIIYTVERTFMAGVYGKTEYYVLVGPGKWKCLPSIFLEEVI